jgi:uncharacterized membrane protein
MLDWILLFLTDLNIAIWLGGLIVIDLIEAPARFRTPGLDRNQIVAVGRQVFAAFNRAEILIGMTLIVVNLLLILRDERSHLIELAPGRIIFAGIGVMTIIALWQYPKFRPRMTEISQRIDLVARDEENPLYGEMKGLHRIYVALDLAKIALGLVVLGFQTLLKL